MSDRTRIAAILILASAALLSLAGPVGDWIGHLNKSEETEISVRPNEPSGPLAQLHIRREPVVAQTPDLPNQEEPRPPQEAPAARPENPETLSNEEINAVIQQHQSQFLHCWTQRLKDHPDLAGKMDLQFEIRPRGKVEDIRILDSTIPDEDMQRCVVSVLERAQFHEFHGRPITLTFPLSFE